MPRIQASNSEAIGLQEFCDWVESHDPAMLGRIGEWPELWERFYSLYNNRSLIVDYLREHLGDPDNFQRHNRYSGQALLLARRACFYIRVNIWPAPSDPLAQLNRRHFDRFYVYGEDYAHDHNFDFLTIGFQGPGYETDLWTYEHASVSGHPGEEVALESCGRVRLAPGVMLLFRRGVDIHVQYPPDALSVSLNFIPDIAPESSQYLFDVASGRIASSELLVPRVRNLELLVGALGDEACRSAFRTLAGARGGRGAPGSRIEAGAGDRRAEVHA